MQDDLEHGHGHGHKHHDLGLDEEQANLKQTLENFNIPLTKKTVTVNSAGAIVNLDGPFGGVRAGLLLGIRF